MSLLSSPRPLAPLAARSSPPPSRPCVARAPRSASAQRFPFFSLPALYFCLLPPRLFLPPLSHSLCRSLFALSPLPPPPLLLACSLARCCFLRVLWGRTILACVRSSDFDTFNISFQRLMIPGPFARSRARTVLAIVASAALGRGSGIRTCLDRSSERLQARLATSANEKSRCRSFKSRSNEARCHGEN